MVKQANIPVEELPVPETILDSLGAGKSAAWCSCLAAGPFCQTSLISLASSQRQAKSTQASSSSLLSRSVGVVVLKESAPPSRLSKIGPKVLLTFRGG